MGNGASEIHGIGELVHEDANWWAYRNIDMCNQGDIEIIHDWRRRHNIEELKRMVINKKYSAVTVSAGEPSFGHAALKKFPFKLTKDRCRPVTTCCRHP